MQAIMIEIISAAIASFGFCLIFHIRKQHLLMATLGAVSSWIVYRIGGCFSSGIFLPALVAAGYSSLYAEIMARIQKAPATLFLIPTIVPLTPGSLLYRTLVSIVRSDWAQAKDYGYETILFAFGLAMGMSLVWVVIRIICDHSMKA